ncbi:MAG: hypothetical protein IPK48_07955 [Gammaproteobacteria bacterium]|nr:hypothetical protein [Gammaproteobacteria bacterium]
MSVDVEFPGDHPVTIVGYALSGFHRPLSGESANLTVSADPALIWPDWLQAPPLGAACSVFFDDATILEGTLAGVRVTTESVELKVEG